MADRTADNSGAIATPRAAAGYSPAVGFESYDSIPSGTPGPQPQGTPRRSAARSVLPWVAGAAIVLTLAVAGGLFTAWLVANMNAAQGPAAGVATPTPQPTAQVSPSASDLPTAQPTDPPRRTPTPSPSLEPTGPPPFVHVVERGESLSEIAEYYQVAVEDIIELNDIRNPNRIRVGQEILIPGYGVIPTPRPRR